MSSQAPHDRDEVTQVNALYHDAIAERYDERFEQYSNDVATWVRGIFEREVYPALDAFGGTSQVVDFGCGSGYLEQFLTERDANLVGLDVSEGMLRRARQTYPQWHFEQQDLYTFDPGRQFHLVMENAVLHHLVEYEELVDKMADLTLPGGVLYLGNEPNRRAYRYLAPLKYAYRQTVNRYRTEDAESLLGDPKYEALSEYHLFYGDGIDAGALADRLRAKGFRRVTVHYSLRELFSALEEAWPRARLNDWAPDRLRDGFPLSRNFTLTAQR